VAKINQYKNETFFIFQNYSEQDFWFCQACNFILAFFTLPFAYTSNTLKQIPCTRGWQREEILNVVKE